MALGLGSARRGDGQRRAPRMQKRRGQVLLTVRGLHRDGTSTGQADIVGTRQDDGLPEKGAAHWALQLLLHRCRRRTAQGGRWNGPSSGDGQRRLSKVSTNEMGGGSITRARLLCNPWARPSLCPGATAHRRLGEGEEVKEGPHLLPARLLHQRLQPAARVRSLSAALAVAYENI